MTFFGLSSLLIARALALVFVANCAGSSYYIDLHSNNVLSPRIRSSLRQGPFSPLESAAWPSQPTLRRPPPQLRTPRASGCARCARLFAHSLTTLARRLSDPRASALFPLTLAYACPRRFFDLPQQALRGSGSDPHAATPSVVSPVTASLRGAHSRMIVEERPEAEPEIPIQIGSHQPMMLRSKAQVRVELADARRAAVHLATTGLGVLWPAPPSANRVSMAREQLRLLGA